MDKMVTIVVVDGNTNGTMSRTFSTFFNGVENEFMLKSMIVEWVKEIPYDNYQLISSDEISSYSDEIQNVLDELEITN